jgi:hypothetical protein
MNCGQLSSGRGTAKRGCWDAGENCDEVMKEASNALPPASIRGWPQRRLRRRCHDASEP